MEMDSTDSDKLPYLICEGIDEPWVEAVHRWWYNDDKKLCFWPPRIKDSSKLRGFVENGYKPDSDWIGYPAKIRKAYETYEKATGKIKRAIKNSEDLLETTDTERNTKRVRVPNKKYLDSEPDELNHGKHQSHKKLKKCVGATRGLIHTPPPSPFEIEKKNKEDNGKPFARTLNVERLTDLPGPSTLIVLKKKHCKFPEKEIQKQQLDIDNIDEEMDNDENYGLVQENSNVDKEQANAKQNMINAYGNLEFEFKLSKNYGLLEPLKKESREAYNTRGIVKLNHGVKDNKMLCKKIFDKIDELEKKLKTSQTTTNESDEEDDDFPISNMDDFDSVNLKLPNETTRKQLRIRLDSIGGKNVGDIVRKICVFCLNKKFARNFSWEGNRGNMCLKDTMLGKVMLGVILKYEKPKIKSHEAILAIQNWLRHAKDGMKAELAAAAAAKKKEENKNNEKEDDSEEDRGPLPSSSSDDED